MNVIIYSKENCPNCVKAMALLEKHNPTVLKLGKEVTRDAFFEKFPGVKTVPQIIINNERIGGFDELEKWFAFREENDDF